MDPALLSQPVLSWIASRSAKLGNPPGWKWVAEDAIVGRLQGALWQLHRAERVKLDPEEATIMRTAYYLNQARWLFWEIRLEQTMAVLTAQGLRIAYLKGAAMHEQIYKDFGVRPMGDVDILVPPEDYLAAADGILSAGLTMKPEAGFTTPESMRAYPVEDLPTELTFTDKSGLVIDLHRDMNSVLWFTPAYPLDLQAVWQRAQKLSDGRYQLATGDFLFQLCLNLTLDGLVQNSLMGYLDVDLLIRTLPPDWDWNVWVKQVCGWGAKAGTHFVLVFCQQFLKTPVPDDVLHALQPGWLQKSILNGLLRPEDLLAARQTMGMRRPSLVRLALMSGPGAVLRVLKKALFPSEDWQMRRYGQRVGLWKHWLRMIRDVKRGI